MQAWRHIACITACLVATACGTAQVTPATTLSGTPSSSAASPTSCQEAAHVDRLVIRRNDPFPQNQIRFSFPAVVTVTEAASVRNTLEALCALPVMPHGTYNCPADFGVTYDLRYSAGRPLAAVSIETSGCEVVHGLGATRWTIGTPGFWHVLGEAMGLPAPTLGTFAGTLPSAPLLCAASMVRIAALTNRRSYGPGETVVLTSSITNTSKSTCTILLGGSSPSLIVTSSKGVEVWDRCWFNDEPGACSMILVAHRLDPGQTYTERARWDQRSGTPSKRPVRVSPGTYHLSTHYEGIAGTASVRFVLRPR